MKKAAYLGIAIAIPVSSPTLSPRELISSVGHDSAVSVHDDDSPMIAPMSTEIKSATISAYAEYRAKDQSRTRLPNV